MRIDLQWLGKTPRAVGDNARHIADVLSEEFRRDLLKSGFHDDVAALVRARIREQREDIFAQRFTPLSQEYGSWKAGVGLGGANLTLTGQSVDAIKGQDDPFGVAVEDVIRRDETIGGRRIRGGQGAEFILRIHQDGRGHNPRRAGFGLSAGQRAFATAAAAQIFRELTLPRVKRLWEAN